jgi:hypothetical protein
MKNAPRRLVLWATLTLLSGCAYSSSGGPKSEPASTVPEIRDTAQIVKQYVEKSWTGASFTIAQEQPCTYRKKPATAVHVKVTPAGERTPQDHLLIVVGSGTAEGAVKDSVIYDPAKPFDATVKALSQESER